MRVAAHALPSVCVQAQHRIVGDVVRAPVHLLRVHPERIGHQRTRPVPSYGHELHSIKWLAGRTTRPLCGGFTRSPPNAPVVTKAMAIDLMTTHNTLSVQHYTTT
jgi:hypothetical protein